MTGVLVILAAGFGRRMRGSDKLLEHVDGVPVIRALAERGLAAGLKVCVTLPEGNVSRKYALQGVDVRIISVFDAHEGLSASLRAALPNLDADFALILPGDMPEITVDDLRAMSQPKGLIVQATSADGTPGHPVRFDRSLFSEFRHLSGDLGAKPIVQNHRDEVLRIALPNNHATTDLDTPEEWAAWRAGQAAR